MSFPCLRSGSFQPPTGSTQASVFIVNYLVVHGVAVGTKRLAVILGLFRGQSSVQRAYIAGGPIVQAMCLTGCLAFWCVAGYIGSARLCFPWLTVRQIIADWIPVLTTGHVDDQFSSLAY